MFRLFLLAQISFLVIGCSSESTGVTTSDCGEDIKLVSYELEESSLDYFSYTQDDELVFEDQDGMKHSFEIETLEVSKEYKQMVKSLCSSGLFGRQWEYYEYEYKSITFRNQLSDDFFSLTLSVVTTDEEDLDDRVVFDKLGIRADFESLGGQIVTGLVSEYKQHGPLAEDNVHRRNNATMIGDTTINTNVYTEVYRHKDYKGMSVYYTKLDGIISISDQEGNYLRLKK